MVPSRPLYYNAVLIAVISISLSSCYTYKPIRISYTMSITSNGFGYERSGKSQIRRDTSHARLRAPQSPDEGAPQRVKDIPQARKYRFYLKKYFALTYGTSPVDRMNKKGVEYALQGKFKEAEILFQEILKEEARCGAALNNLGIVYEIFCHYDRAFRMYAQACLLEPENEKFRSNFLSLKKMKRTSRH